MNPSVSILMPVFNGMPHLPESIKSIQKQTVTDWELVIVDDGSTDDSFNYLQQVASIDRRISLFKHPANRGVAAAYNTAITYSNARYIAFQEQDDISVPHRIETELNIMKEYNASFVTSRVGWMNETGKIFNYWPRDISKEVEVTDPGLDLYFSLLIHQTRFANATTMLDRNTVFGDNLAFDERFKHSGQDWDFHLRLVQRFASVRIKQILLLMRRHEKHFSSTSIREVVFHDNRLLIRKHQQIRITKPSRIREIRYFRQAWANEFLIEARYYRGLRGLLYGALSILLWPRNPESLRSLRNIVKHPFAKKRIEMIPR